MRFHLRQTPSNCPQHRRPDAGAGIHPIGPVPFALVDVVSDVARGVTIDGTAVVAPNLRHAWRLLTESIRGPQRLWHDKTDLRK